MYQARVTRVGAEGDRVAVTVRADRAGAARGSRDYVLEIVTEEGEFLSVPNEAIIETGGKQRGLRAGADGTLRAAGDPDRRAGRAVHRRCSRGSKAGEQVVTFGSFFIDAEHKLKGS